MKNYVYQTNDEPLEQLFKKEYDEIVGTKSVLIQIFSGESKEKIEKLLDFIKSNFSHAATVFASSDGEIYQDRVLTQSSVISISLFESTELKTTHKRMGDSFANGEEVAKELITPKTKLIIAFTDGIRSNGEAFLRGIYSVAPDVKVAGGLAGDNGKLIKTFIGIDGDIYDGGAVAVALDSEVLHVDSLYNFGWKSIGLPHQITSSRANRVYTIDDMTAVDFYKKYLGKDVAHLLPAIGIEFPLIIKRKGLTIARAVIAKHDDGSLSFAGEIPQGENVHIGVGDKLRIISNPINKESLMVEAFYIYSCMARRRFLPDLIEQEIKHFANIAPTSGFFTYGEFYTNEKPELLNQTLTAVALSESNKEIKIEHENTLYNTKSDHDTTLAALTNILEITSEELANVTQLRKTDMITSQQAKLVQMGEMINMIAHQWRQPLNSISTAAIKLNMQSELDLATQEEIKKTTKFIEKTAQEMSKTINDFMDFTKPRNKKELVKVKDIVNDILRIMGAQLKNHNITFVQEIEKELTITTFSTDLEHVLINLFSNARDVLDERRKENKEIRLKAYKKDKDCIIEVSDNGGGIADDIINRVFEPYFTTKEQGKGTGIGLYMSKKIVETSLNGTISVKNIKDGAKFSIRLRNCGVSKSKTHQI